MSSTSLRPLQLHLAATSTGSVFFRVGDADVISIQVTKTTASQVATFELYGSNASENSNTNKPPGWTSGSLNSSTADWAPISEVALTALTGSAMASVMNTLGQVGTRWLEVRTYSISGGVFKFRPWAKS